MSQNFRALFVPKSLKVKIACTFLRREPAAWFERTVQPRIYRWNKFRSLLERNFGSFGVEWERRMVKEFGNSTDDSSGGLGQYEGASPSNAPGRDSMDNSSDDGDDEEDLEEDPKEEIDETETLEKGVVCKG